MLLCHVRYVTIGCITMIQVYCQVYRISFFNNSIFTLYDTVTAVSSYKSFQFPFIPLKLLTITLKASLFIFLSTNNIVFLKQYNLLLKCDIEFHNLREI